MESQGKYHRSSLLLCPNYPPQVHRRFHEASQAQVGATHRIRFYLYLLYSYFDCDSLAELYYLEIIKNDNEYKDLSYAALSKIDSIGEWNSLLYEQVSDSIKYNRLLKRVIKAT